jgi:hypothetical protein
MTIAVCGLFSLRSFAKHIHPREAHALRGSGSRPAALHRSEGCAERRRRRDMFFVRVASLPALRAQRFLAHSEPTSETGAFIGGGTDGS